MSATVRNCPEAGAGPCPWDRLAPGPDPSTRHCDRCDRAVSLCASAARVLDRLRAGHLVAWAEPTAADLGAVYAEGPGGFPAPLAWGPPTPDQAVARRLRALGMTIADAVRNARDASRDCPGCGCPVPNYRVACRVCGAAVGRLYDADGNVRWADRPG